MSEPIQPQTTPSGKMIATMVLVSGICGVLIVGAIEGTQDGMNAIRNEPIEQGRIVRQR